MTQAPTQIPLLSTASEAKLAAAVDAVVDAVQTGTSPSDAVLKVAQDAGFNRGFTELLLRAYNTGASLSHIQSTDDPFEKAAAIELADSGSVLGRMFPPCKTAAAAARDTVSPEYSRPPVKSPIESLHQENLVKVAAALQPTGPLPVALQGDLERGRSVDRLQDARLALRLKEARAAGINYATVGQLAALREYFTLPDAVPYREARENCQLSFGKAAAAVFAELERSSPELVKAASAPPAQRPAPVRWDQAPYTLVEQIFSLAKEAQNLQTEVAMAKQAVEEGQQQLNPFADRPRTISGSIWESPSSQDQITEPASSKEAASATTLAGFLGPTAIGNKLTEHASKLKNDWKADQDKELNKTFDSLNSPDHLRELHGIRAQAVLHQLMTDDPVVSAHPHEHVLQAFNELNELAPHVMLNHVTARMAMRKYLEQGGNLDQFDTGETLGIEHKLLKQFPQGYPKQTHEPATAPSVKPAAPDKKPQ